jgi:hypothetical protein
LSPPARTGAGDRGHTIAIKSATMPSAPAATSIADGPSLASG